jgi:hypothetical protein
MRPALAIVCASLKITLIQVTEEGNYERTYFCNWFLWVVHDDVTEPKLTFFADEAWFYLSGNTNAQNNIYWSSINLRQTSEVPFQDQKIHV